MKRPTNLLAGLTSGLVAGLAASFIMEGFQRIWANAEPIFRDAPRKPETDEPATVKAADMVTRLVAGTRVPERYRPVAGDVMHYALGGVIGAAYGVGSELHPLSRTGKGAAYGTLVWLVLDEGMLPLLKLARRWDEVPDRTHAFAWLSHVVFGLSLEAVRAATRRRPARWGEGGARR